MMGFVAQFDTLRRVLDPLARKLEDSSKKIEKWQGSLNRADRRLEEVRHEINELAQGRGPKLTSKMVGGKRVFESDDEAAQKALEKLRKRNAGFEQQGFGGIEESSDQRDQRVAEAVGGERMTLLRRQERYIESSRGRTQSQIDKGVEEQEILEEQQRSAEEFKGKISAGAAAAGVAFSVLAGMIKDETFEN